MKQLVVIISNMFFSSVVLATPLKTKIDVDVKQTLDLKWSKVVIYRHSANCYPMGKSNGYGDLGSELLEVSNKQSEEKRVSLPIKSKSYPFRLGELKFELETSQKVDGENTAFAVDQIAVKVTNNTNFSSYQHIGDSNCVQRQYHWRVDSQRIDGTYTVWFKMPQNTWVVSLSVSDAEGGAAIIGKNLTGDLHSAAIEEDLTYVWAAPDTWIGVPVDAHFLASPKEIGSFKINVRRPIFPFDENIAESQLKGFPAQFSKGTELSSTSKTFLDFGSRYLFSNGLSQKLSQTLGQQTYRTISDWLFLLANSSESAFGPLERHTKAMAAVLGYELAAELLTDMQVFCKQMDVYLPLSNVKTRVPGFVAAHYWLNRDVRRLSALKFPEIRAYLEELVRWENNGLKYSDIAKNSGEFQKLRAGFMKIRQHSEFAFDVYGDIAAGIQKTVEAFGPSVASNTLLESVLMELKVLADERRDLNRAFQAEVMAFNLKNGNAIQSSQVLKRVIRLEKQSDELAQKLLSEVRLVSLNPEDSQQTATTIMASLLAHQIGIFDEQLNTPFAEAVRLTFVKKTQTAHFEQSFKQCLTGGQ